MYRIPLPVYRFPYRYRIPQLSITHSGSEGCDSGSRSVDGRRRRARRAYGSQAEAAGGTIEFEIFKFAPKNFFLALPLRSDYGNYVFLKNQITD